MPLALFWTFYPVNNKSRSTWSQQLPRKGNIVQQRQEQFPEKPSSLFLISSHEIRKRNRNLLWGVFLSLLLAALITIGNYRDPVTYSNALLWSIIAFLVLANLVNTFRYLRYRKLIRKHRVEIKNNKMVFYTGDHTSELDMSNITIMQTYSKPNKLLHIQLRLKNNRGIRLEGYDQLETMASLIAAQLQPGQVIDRKALFG